ncbi:MAG: histidinol-phosphate aminotransferase [Vicingaceae bacterium]|jgi:histidinol-phosphate aminotransferase
MYDLKKIVRPSILALQPYSSARDEFNGNNATFLDANENPFGELNRYPDPYQKELKQKLSNLKTIPTENIFIGNGSDEVIDLTCRIFCNPGKDKALTFSPTYGMYDVSAGINNIELIQDPLNKDFQINTDGLSTYLNDDRLKLIFICSPNNPTGNSIKLKAIKYILNNFTGIVNIDEAYIDFSETVSWVNELNNYPNLIVSQTFSKAWGLAAARVGAAYASKEIIALFNKVKPPYNVSQLNQQAAINALGNTVLFEENKQLILNEKKRLVESLAQINLITKIYPSDANFLLVQVVDANKTYADLVQKRVITRNRNNVIENCIRITVGNKEENNLLIDALKNIEQ